MCVQLITECVCCMSYFGLLYSPEWTEKYDF